jgi:DNA-binding Xre family transcriptional regulator
MAKRSATDPHEIWRSLNERQQKYLEFIYIEDQAAERWAKRSWSRGESSQPASEWRALFYGDIALNRSSKLKTRLSKANLVDPGTGSTFQALERRNLIECEGEVPDLDIKLTSFGRKVARIGLEVALPKKPSKKPPKGMLSEIAWKALGLAYCAGEQGIKPQWGFRYAGIHSNTWDRLHNNLKGPLVEEVYHQDDSRVGGVRPYRIHITPIGLEFYRLNWEQYQALYPDIGAPRPCDTGSGNEKKPAVNIGTLVRIKRGGRGLKEIAKEIGDGIRPSTISRIEKGKEVEDYILKKICIWLSVKESEHDCRFS